MAVKVQFEIGHTSKLRSKKTVEGFTHDWELYVKGVQHADINAFVEKIIFNLHESFQKPKRVCNKPPYVIQESGYAGFVVFIDIYFRNRDEPKKVQFNYDLDLQQTGPPQHRHDVKTFIFDNPSEEYRLKLLKGGGVPVSGVVGGSQPTINNNIVAIPTTVSLNHSPGDGHKPILVDGKKHKLRPDDTRSNSFANLFGPPITKTLAVAPTAVTKHSPDNKTVVAAAHATQQPSSASAVLPALKEKSSKDKEKSSEKSKERSEKREKHHKQSLTSPHKEGRSESKKSDGSKHEKKDKTEEKSKKDKSRDKERERDRDKPSGANNSSSSSKRPTSPRPAREHSPHKGIATGVVPPNVAVSNTNSIPRPLSSNSGKIDEIKTSSKPSKDSFGESKSKEPKQKESSSSSSSKKSKKEKKDKDKERDKEKRHEEREKQKLAVGQQRSSAKEDGNKITNNVITNANNANSLENKNSKSTTSTPLKTNGPNDVGNKPEKLAKQDLFKVGCDKPALSSTMLTPPAPTANNSTHSSTEKKTSSTSSLNSNSNATEKDKRSHKHKKKEKSKDKDKDRERDKERDKDKDKERDKDKDKEKEKEKEKQKELKKERETREKHPEEKTVETISSSQQTPNVTKALLTPAVNATEGQPITLTTSVPSTSASNAAPYITTTTTAMPLSSSSSSSTKSSKNKEKKSKDKSSTKEEKLKHKANNMDSSESKAKQAKLSGANSINSTPSLSTSSSASSVTNAIANAITPNPTLTNSAVETNLNLGDSNSLSAATMQQVQTLVNDSVTKPSLQTTAIITHSDSSNSSFPELPLPKPQTRPATSHERLKPITAPVAVPSAPLPNPATKEPTKNIKSNTKEKLVDKSSKEEEKEKKRRRNSQAVNTFIEPPLKQLKTKEQPKSIRDKSKSPSLRNTGSRASISADTSTTFLQPSVSPSSTAAAAPLPPPSATSAAHSPALSATEAVGNAISVTANAATCNNNSAPSSTTNSTIMAAPHHLPLDYLSELQELHHKIMTLQDNEELQHVVELIAATGCYEITTKTFDFDLCKLDRATVQRLQEFFATSVS